MLSLLIVIDLAHENIKELLKSIILLSKIAENFSTALTAQSAKMNFINFIKSISSNQFHCNNFIKSISSNQFHQINFIKSISFYQFYLKKSPYTLQNSYQANIGNFCTLLKEKIRHF